MVCTLGVDIGGTNLRMGCVDKEKQVLCFEKKSASLLEGDEPVVRLCDILREYIDGLCGEYEVDAVCVGFPAAIDKQRETVLSAPNLKGFDGVNVGAALERALGIPVYLERDVNLLLLADLTSSGCEDKDVVGVYVGTGVGNAVMLDGKLRVGENGVAGELGHIPFGDATEVCGCGNVGCAESLVGGLYLAALRETQYPETPMSLLFKEHGGDAVLTKYIDRLARVVAAEVNVLDPARLLLGGGVIAMEGFPRETFEARIRAYLRKPYPCNTLKFSYSDAGAASGVLGAGIYAWQRREKSEERREKNARGEFGALRKERKRGASLYEKMLSPSLMCANIGELKETLRAFEENGVEYIHIDVMDGEFVPNMQFGTDTVRQIRTLTKIPLDIHLMITHPEDKLAWFDAKEGEYVAIHAESTAHVQKCLAAIRASGAKAMLALNPATPLSVLEDVLDDCDGVLLMSVNPGFAGQKIIPAVIKKVARLRKMLDERGYAHIPIEVDGNVSFENARLLSDAGAQIFVAGTSSVFHKDYTLSEAIARLRASVE